MIIAYPPPPGLHKALSRVSAAVTDDVDLHDWMQRSHVYVLPLFL
mgnify:CR=1 FL=1